jgi:CubicO group peptidase (beta-lactamase class C family)
MPREDHMTIRRRAAAAAFALAATLSIWGCATRTGTEAVRGDVGQRLDTYLSRATPFGFAGAVLVSRDGEVQLMKGYGEAVRDQGVANTASTVFSAGPIARQFTAAAVLRLEADGRLSTSDTIDRFLADVPQDKAGITLGDLLTNTSGVTDFAVSDGEEVGLDEAVRGILDRPLAFEPGSSRQYSGAGYVLLGAVVERASGKPYEEVLREVVFLPAGMEHTGYRLPDWGGAVVAHWYDGLTDNGSPLDRPSAFSSLLGDGGILTTAGDLLRWYEALRDDTILTAEERERLWSATDGGNAYGWRVEHTDRGLVVQCDGGNGLGSSAAFRWFVDRDLVIAVLCNQSYQGGPLSRAVSGPIETIAFGGGVELPSGATASLSRETLAEFPATYRLLGSDAVFLVSLVGDALSVSTYSQAAIDALYFPASEDPAPHQALNLRANALVAAAVSGAHDVFLRELGDPEVAAGLENALRRRIAQFAARTGQPPIMALSLGTVPWGSEGLLATGVRIRNSRGDGVDVSLLWRDGTFVRLIDRGHVAAFPLVPVSEREFAGYDLELARGVLMSFSRDESGAVSALIVTSGGIGHEAARVGPPAGAAGGAPGGGGP